MMTLGCFLIGICVGLHLCMAIAAYCIGGDYREFRVWRHVIPACIMSVTVMFIVVTEAHA